MLGGAIALAWCAYIVTDAAIVQRLAHEALASQSRVNETLVSRPPPGAPASIRSSAEARVARGTPLAELSIPSVGLSAVVLHGSDDHTLRLGLGHIENTPLPGEPGNVAIAGHRDSFFRPLRNVQVGDDIVLDTPEERMHYRVSWFRVVDPTDVGVIGPTKNAALTLVTCYPFSFIGPAPDRFIVRAVHVEDPAADAPSSSATSSVASSAPPIRGANRTAFGDDSATDAVVSLKRGDESGAIQSAVEHFRLTYNARLARHDGVTDAIARFQHCDLERGRP